MNLKLIHWNAVYRKGDIPWDSNRPDPELVSLVNSGLIKGKKALEVGCGTGTNVIYLSKKGFDAVGVDISQVAVIMADEKAAENNVRPRLYAADVLDLSFLKEKFDLVFDRGCFHHLATEDRQVYVKQVSSKLKKGGYLLLLTICDKDKSVHGPNKVSYEDITKNFSKDFNILKIEEKRLDDQIGPLAYTTLMMKK